MSIAKFFALCGATQDTILATTAFASTVMAAVLLLIYYKVLPEQHWIKYLGLAYCVFFFQYLLSWATVHMIGDLLGLYKELTLDAIQASFSIVNNIFLFLSAMVLLGISRGIYVIIVIGSLAEFVLFFILPDNLERFPDKIIAFIILSLLGWAFYVNVRDVGNRKIARWLLAGCGFYALVNIIYAQIPLFIQLDRKLHDQVYERIVPLNEALAKQITVQVAYDSVIFAVALILKLVVFASALALIMRSLFIMTPKAYRNMLEEVVDGDTEFLDGNGIVKAIGRNLGADFAAVCLRVPRIEKKKVVWMRWLRDAPDDFSNFEITDIPDIDDSVVGCVLATGEKITSRDHSSDPNIKGYLEYVKGMKALITIPIRYHGSTVGALNLEWREKLASNEPALILPQMQILADYLAASIQSERQLSTLDQFSNRLPRLELKTIGKGERLLRQVAVAHDSMCPLATGIGLEIGFRALWAACNDEQKMPDRLVPQGSDPSTMIIVGKEVRKLAMASGYSDTEIRVSRSKLRVFKSGSEFLNIGILRMAYPAKNTRILDIARAPLGANSIHRRTVATMIADALLDSARVELGGALSELQILLQSRDIESTEDWLNTVDGGIQKAGLLWAIARTAGRKPLLGSPSAVKIVEGILEGGDPDQLLQEEMEVHDLATPNHGTYHVISMHLAAADGHLWFGVNRNGFGDELTWNSPWKTFLEQLREAAGTTLLRILSTMEIERLALEKSRAEGLNRTLVTMGTMTHQLANFATGFSVSVDSMDEAAKLGTLNLDDGMRETLAAMKQSTAKLKEILKPLTATTVFNDQRPCDLEDVINHARKLHDIALLNKEIKWKQPQSGASLLINVPRHVATLALANLISNSLDALDHGGEIEITVQERENTLICNVRDSGPGLPDFARTKPFELGVTTKDASGGWGLYLTRRSLRENLADIVLSETGATGTVFTMFFPRPIMKEVHYD